MGFRQWPPGNPNLRYLSATCVTEATCFNLLAQTGRCDAALRISCARIAGPRDAFTLIEANCESFARIVPFSERPPPSLPVARPIDMTRTSAMTRLAADAYFRPGRRESIVDGIVILAHTRRVAFGAHEIPVLVQLGPVQDVIVPYLLLRIQMEPALSALLSRAAISGDR